ncbi:MAG TPA: sugar ABC transporter substrate-binding protein [Porticoccaceae bacterium]|jgi:polysaccharide export outer membrane protein|nr:sugar ABC transporter substrate-binding protein [Porticoccaceae bacterium]
MDIKTAGIKPIALSVFLILTSTVAAVANAAPALEAYLLNPGDQLMVSVWNEESLERTITVLPDGKISFPLVGHLTAAGETASVLEDKITAKLDAFIADPEVNVTVTNTRGNVSYVVGKVLKPGPIVMVQATTVMQALAMAGGLNEFASANSIKIIRSTGEQETLLKVRYSDLEKGSDLSSNHRLEAGDVIVVP